MAEVKVRATTWETQAGVIFSYYQWAATPNGTGPIVILDPELGAPDLCSGWAK
jgi:hypothetical protein